MNFEKTVDHGILEPITVRINISTTDWKIFFTRERVFRKDNLFFLKYDFGETKQVLASNLTSYNTTFFLTIAIRFIYF